MKPRGPSGKNTLQSLREASFLTSESGRANNLDVNTSLYRGTHLQSTDPISKIYRHPVLISLDGSFVDPC